MNCIKDRLVDSKKERQFHNMTAYIPLSAAILLRENPSLISPVVRAFFDRDTIDLKSCRAMKHFPPETRVYAKIRFTRCLYAMLTHSRYNPERITGWQLPSKNDLTFKAHEIGMKIACGFEILASRAVPVNDLSMNRDWQLFLNQIKTNGYFGENIEHSKEYTKKLKSAEEYYKMFVESRPLSSMKVSEDVLSRLKSLNRDEFPAESMQKYTQDDDNEDWLNISEVDLDRLLMERYGIKKTLSSSNAQEANDLTESLDTFLNEKSEFDGVDIRPVLSKLETKRELKLSQSHAAKNGDVQMGPANKPDADNQPISFNPDAFQTHLKEMLDFCLPEENWESQSDMSDFDDEMIGNRIDEMGAGASDANGQFNFTSYMEQMEQELKSTTIGKSFQESNQDDNFDDIESFEPVNIDVASIQNLTKSYQSQLGGHGPASTLLGNLGIRLNAENKDHNKNESPSYDTKV